MREQEQRVVGMCPREDCEGRLRECQLGRDDLHCDACGEVVPLSKPASECGDCGDTGTLFNGAYCICPAGTAHWSVPNIKDAQALAVTWIEGDRETVIKGICCLSPPFAAWMALQVGIALGENNGRQDFLRMLAERVK